MIVRGLTLNFPVFPLPAPRPDAREAAEAEALRREGERFDADVAAQERFRHELDAAGSILADMTAGDRAELRFALHCDPELQSPGDDRRSPRHAASQGHPRP